MKEKERKNKRMKERKKKTVRNRTFFISVFSVSLIPGEAFSGRSTSLNTVARKAKKTKIYIEK